MWNIKCVVLWELPPSFCALVQRAGRAARDFDTLGEAILIVPSSIIAKGTTVSEVEAAIETVQVDALQRPRTGARMRLQPWKATGFSWLMKGVSG